MARRDGDLGGAVFVTGFDLYPIRPLAIAGGYAIGRLGTATLRQGRIEAGGFVGAAEIAIGWERTSIGAVSFGGPYAALRWWF